MSNRRDKKDTVFTFRLNEKTDGDIIEYIRQSNQSISLTVRYLLRNAFDRSMDFQAYQNLLQELKNTKNEILEQQQTLLKQQLNSPSAAGENPTSPAPSLTETNSNDEKQQKGEDNDPASDSASHLAKTMGIDFEL